MLIVLTGAIGAGKSTVAEILVKDFHFKELTFAEPLKQFALSVGFTSEQIYGTQEQKDTILNEIWGISGRRFMQTFGTDIMRRQNFFPDFWVRALEAKLSAISPYENVVISDARFPNEIQMTKKFNSRVVRIERFYNHHQEQHESENSLNDYEPDITLYNIGSISELRKKVDHMFFKSG